MERQQVNPKGDKQNHDQRSMERENWMGEMVRRGDWELKKEKENLFLNNTFQSFFSPFPSPPRSFSAH